MTTAREIMHEGVQCISEHDTMVTAAQMMRDLDVGALPICGDDDKLHGMITDRDIVVGCLAAGADPATMTAREMATGAPHWISADVDVREVLAMMEQHHIRRLPVIDNHRLVGMISAADLGRNLTDEQIAGFMRSITVPA